MFDDIEIEPDPLQLQLEGLLKWFVEDYGEGIVSSLILELMKAAHLNPQLSLAEIIDEVRLDWSK